MITANTAKFMLKSGQLASRVMILQEDYLQRVIRHISLLYNEEINQDT
jgi:hypothetical protein